MSFLNRYLELFYSKYILLLFKIGIRYLTKFYYPIIFWRRFWNEFPPSPPVAAGASSPPVAAGASSSPPAAAGAPSSPADSLVFSPPISIKGFVHENFSSDYQTLTFSRHLLLYWSTKNILIFRPFERKKWKTWKI